MNDTHSNSETDPTNEAEDIVKDVLDGHDDLCSCEEGSIAAEDAIVAEAPDQWRPAEALKTLKAQINARFPNRNKLSDGTVGDPAHQSRKSDHNPWIREGGMGVVSAIDITHDPKSGCDANRVVAALHASRDPRIKYLIWNRRIANSSTIGSVPAWTWRTYGGANPHNHHFHLSVKSEKRLPFTSFHWRVRISR